MSIIANCCNLGLWPTTSDPGTDGPGRGAGGCRPPKKKLQQRLQMLQLELAAADMGMGVVVRLAPLRFLLR